jgi:hypothetical protein
MAEPGQNAGRFNYEPVKTIVGKGGDEITRQNSIIYAVSPTEVCPTFSALTHIITFSSHTERQRDLSICSSG